MRSFPSTFTCLFAAGALLLTASCTAARSHKAYLLDDVSDVVKAADAVKDAAGFAPMDKVPDLRQRFTDRPGLRVAILQFGVQVQGELDEGAAGSFDFARAIAGRSRYVPTPEVAVTFRVSPDFGMAVAARALTTLETALSRKGFNVIPAERVAATRAYRAAYNPFTYYGVTRADASVTNATAWTGFSARGLRLFPPRNVADVPHAYLGVDATAMKAIGTELGGEVIFLLVTTKLGNHQVQRAMGKSADGREQAIESRVGRFEAEGILTITDPEFASQNAVSHYVAYTDVHLLPAPRPQYMRAVAGGTQVDWPSLWSDAASAHAFIFESMADVLAARASI